MDKMWLIAIKKMNCLTAIVYIYRFNIWLYCKDSYYIFTDDVIIFYLQQLTVMLQ